jgi:hypothetical protein
MDANGADAIKTGQEVIRRSQLLGAPLAPPPPGNTSDFDGLKRYWEASYNKMAIVVPDTGRGLMRVSYEGSLKIAADLELIFSLERGPESQ